MRVVADINTVVSAFLWSGPPAAVLVAAREGRITLFTSPVLLAELEDVLSREKFAERSVRVGSSVAQMLAGYRSTIRNAQDRGDVTYVGHYHLHWREGQCADSQETARCA